MFKSHTHSIINKEFNINTIYKPQVEKMGFFFSFLPLLIVSETPFVVRKNLILMARQPNGTSHFFYNKFVIKLQCKLIIGTFLKYEPLAKRRFKKEQISCNFFYINSLDFAFC